MDKDCKVIFYIGGTVLAIILAVMLYSWYESSRRLEAYYACLRLSQNIVEQQHKDNGIRVVSLPYCKI